MKNTSALRNYHVSPSNKKWSLRKSGAKRALKLYDGKPKAWAEACRRAKKEHVIAYLHDKNGRIVRREPNLNA